MVLQHPDPADVVALIEARVQAIELPIWPIYGLDSVSHSGFLSGVGEEPDAITSIRLDYRPPGHPERLIVQTSRGDTVNLQTVLLSLSDGGDEGEPLPLGEQSNGATDEAATITIDGVAARARTCRKDGATAWAVLHDHLVILVVAITTAPPVDVQLRRITDLQPLKQARSQMVAAALRAQRDI